MLVRLSLEKKALKIERLLRRIAAEVELGGNVMLHVMLHVQYIQVMGVGLPAQILILLYRADENCSRFYYSSTNSFSRAG